MSQNTEGSRTVLLDMDGVLADFERPNNEILRVHFPCLPVVERRESIYFADTYREQPDVVTVIERKVRLPGFFASFPLIDDALTGMERIRTAGFIPRICSSPLENHPTVIAEKTAWLKQHFVPIFGPWVIETAIFDRNKSSYDAFALIDDHPKVRGADQAKWRQMVFDQPYNRETSTGFRLLSWTDPSLEEQLIELHRLYLEASQTG